jgi:hypothetical protein
MRQSKGKHKIDTFLASYTLKPFYTLKRGVQGGRGGPGGIRDDAIIFRKA